MLIRRVTRKRYSVIYLEGGDMEDGITEMAWEGKREES